MPRTSSFVLATDREVQNAKARGHRPEFRIKGARNLVLRITANGTKSWTFLYASPVTGKRCKMSLGEYPAVGLAQAKRDALALTLAVRDGKDPLSERRVEEAVETFDQLAVRYIAEHELKNARGGKRSSSTDDAQRLLNADILPVIGTCRAEMLTKRHVMSVVEAVADRGAYVAADRVLGLIRAIYNWANATGRLDVDPTLGLKKRNASRPRERVLSDAEIRQLWQALSPLRTKAPPSGRRVDRLKNPCRASSVGSSGLEGSKDTQRLPSRAWKNCPVNLRGTLTDLARTCDRVRTPPGARATPPADPRTRSAPARIRGQMGSRRAAPFGARP